MHRLIFVVSVLPSFLINSKLMLPVEFILSTLTRFMFFRYLKYKTDTILFVLQTKTNRNIEMTFD